MSCNCNDKKTLNLKVRKQSDNTPSFIKLEKGDWIDLAICDVLSYGKSTLNMKPIKWKRDSRGIEYINIKKGHNLFISLGFSAEIPEGYEAHILPRSSTYPKYGLELTNNMGIIDNSYSGNKDIWKAFMKCEENVRIDRYTRLLQFRLESNQDKLDINYVDDLKNDERGGYGSTGDK